MAHQLHVAFVWHMHQPLYKDRASGRYLMPWVRLHATKDYLDMLTLLADYPSHRQTFNLVPSLLEQLEDYAKHDAWDRALELLVRPVDDFTADDKQYLFERAFDASWATMVRPHARYAALLDKREALRHVPSRRAIAAFGDADWGDLVTWFNLAWFDPMFLERDPALGRLVAKGSYFDLADREALCQLIRAYVGRVIPTYKAFAEQGRVELTTTPYYHPILPLLCDNRSARAAHSELPLPLEPFAWPADAEAQIAKGVAAFERHFGHRPAGMWPSEQAVSPAALELIARAGLSWAISDEGVLGRTLGRRFVRDAYGVPPDAVLLYQPYRVRTAAGPVSMVFRDQVLSDLIGFTYAQMDPEAAANDLHRRLDRTRRLLPDGEPYLVTIALDGENCWEHYFQDGAPFLNAFYQKMAADPALFMVTVSEHLAAHPPRRDLANLFAGSWINSDFTTWIGDPTKNLGWEALSRARQALEDARERLTATPAWAEALEELHIAEGSDWFWWYGVGHDSGQDERFDEQFRLHLRRLYVCLGLVPPPDLDAPIAPLQAGGDPLTGGMRPPVLDGNLGAGEWTRAAVYDPTAGQGAMHAAAKTIKRILYGCDRDHLYMALAWADAFDVAVGDEVGIFFFHPGRMRLNAALPYAADDDTPDTARYQFGHAVRLEPAMERAVIQEAGESHAWHTVGEPREWMNGKALELALPVRWLDAEPGQELRFVVAVVRHGQLLEILPLADGLAFNVSTGDMVSPA